MAAIKNLNGMTAEQVSHEIKRGGRFVMYQYTLSLIFVTFQRSSDIFFIPGHERGIARGMGFTCISLLFGWWGLPWGPIRTIGSVACNFSGGKDVTQEVIGLMDSFGGDSPAARQVA